MNLKTHTVYAETMVDHATGEWVSRLITGPGETKETFTGTVEKGTIIEMNRAAGKAAHVEISKVADSYLIPEEETEEIV